MDSSVPKPVLIYDGDCGFCRRQVARWQTVTGDRVEYVPSPEARFDNVPRERLEAAVVLVMPGGEVLDGAEAVFRALACAPGRGARLWAYRRLPGFAPAAEWVYRLIARHRRAASRLDRLVSGTDPAPSSYGLSRWLFLRLLGAIYLVAFVSLWVQVHGLIGADGILPVSDFLEAVAQRSGAERYWNLPTLCWIDAGDGFLTAQCIAGTVLAVALIIGIAPIPVLFLLWLGYLSLTVAGQTFFSFQWDSLLLETGFLAMFVAPAQLLPRISRQRPPPAIGLWLEKWLLFKLMFLSGITKLLSGDSTWRDMTALDFHYQTQPLPTWIGWYAHQLPEWFQKMSTSIMYVIEIGLPLLLFGPRRLRHGAALGIVGFMVLIGVTGNYNFFNLLAVSLCVLMLDDQFLRWILPSRGTRRFVTAAVRDSVWRRAMGGAAAVLIMVPSVLVLVREMVRTVDRSRRVTPVVLALTDPLRTINGYGLFRVMTTERPEIIIEGSRDGETWIAYQFRWKPGDVKRPPGFVEPHQPRLDWQMWFAALYPPGHEHWLLPLVQRLLEGSPEVQALLGENPFPDGPPRWIRMTMYDYEFTDLPTRRTTGDWWTRRLTRVLLRPASLPAKVTASSET